ncbi:MAG TPA: trypsin-like peptidase domain-containing protein [Micromonosporaceae bacterium]|jgi:putative serine protease PepD
MSEHPSEDGTGITERPVRPRRRPSAGWLVGGAAAVAAVGLGIAALVVALNDSDNTTPAASSAANASSEATCSATTIAERELPSVVTIKVSGADASGTGSGEVIDDSGHILTNNHVIAAAATGGMIQVVFSDGQAEAAKLIGRDPQTDVAVLQVADGSAHRPIAFGSSADLQVGQPVVALGAPLGLSSTVTTGIVSALDRSIDVPADNGKTAILVAAVQTDAAINPGNSGGALVNCAGQLVGVPSAGASVPTGDGGSSAGSIGIGFAIPSDFAKSIASELIANGSINHGYFGLSVTTVAAAGKAPAQTGLYVTSVTPGGPAQQAGLRAGDVITDIDGSPVTSAEQLLTLTLTNRPGDVVPMTYERQNATAQARVTLGSA